MSKLKWLLKLGGLWVAFALTLVGPAPASSAAFKVAVITTGPLDDRGWSQAAYEGLKQIQRELGAKIAISPWVTAKQAPEHFKRYGRAGFDFVVGNGGEYLPAALAATEEFPHTKFAVVGNYVGNNRNLGALSFRSGEMGYLSGVVAALKTQTKKVAHIGGMPTPRAQEAAILFKRGVHAIDPSIQVTIVWIGSWTDAQKAEKVAQGRVARGADVLAVDADIASLGALKVAKRAGIYLIGWAAVHRDMAPRTVLTSVIQRQQVLLKEGATLVLKKQWEGKQYKFGLREGAQDLAPFYGMLSPEEERRVNTIKNDVRLGKLDVTMPTELSDRKKGVR